MNKRIVDIREGMRFGMGVDSITEKVKGEAISFKQESEPKGGQKVTASMRLVESQSSLMEAMNISVGLSARYGLAAGDLKFDLALQRAVNEYSLTVLFQADVRNGPRHMIAPQLTAQASELYRRDPNKFLATYGDAYVDEIYGGGELLGLFVFNTRDESSRSDLKVSLDASVGAFMAGADLKASFENTIQRHSRSATMQIWVAYSGGAGLKNPRNLEELSTLYSEFNANVQKAPVDYRASLKEFRYLPLPETTPWLEQVVRSDTIQQCGQLAIAGIGLRSKLDYVLANPRQFEPFDRAAAEAARAAVVHNVARAARRANECADELERCTLEGLEPVHFELPKRLLSSNPLAAKWEKLLLDDRAKAYFAENLLEGTDIDAVQPYDGGAYKLFTRNGVPVSGIFWNPRVGPEAYGVYGSIFAAYAAKGVCEGPLGFPTSDEETLKYGQGPLGTKHDGLDRISNFEHGVLWWDAQTNVVSDRRPASLFTHVLKEKKLNPFILR